MNYAYWRKCDFQIHTPRDPNWQGPRPTGENDDLNGTPASMADVDQQRQDWANEFVSQCIARGLEAIAVTDHHEMVMVPYVRKAIERKKKEDASVDMWLLPGMELTCRGGVQCIILFDSDLEDEWLSEAQSKIGIVKAAQNSRSKQGPAVTQLDLLYPDISEKLDQIPELKARYIVLPNVSEGGQHTVVKNAMHADFSRMPYVGGYLDNGQSISTLGGKHRRRISGEEDIWGSRFIYPLPTSDSRSADYKKLGRNNCWIKMASATAEAVRQAYLGHRSRISLVPPVLTSVSITEVRVSGSAIFEKIDLSTSSELNSIIGGRGSGKSTLLEYIAFGLGRSCHDLKKVDYSGQDRLESLIQDTLVKPSASIELDLLQDGAKFAIHRSPQSSYSPVVTYPDGSREEVSLKDLRSLFPGVVYSQGELSEIGKKTEQKAQLSDLLQFVDPQFKIDDDNMARQVEVGKREVRAALQELSASWEAEAELHKLVMQKGSLTQRIQALEKNLPELPEEDRQKVSRFDDLVAQDGLRVTCEKHAQSVLEALGDLKRKAEASPKFIQSTDEAQGFKDAYADFSKMLVDGVDALVGTLAKSSEKITLTGKELSQSLEAARTDRNLVMEKLTEHKAATDQIVRLKEELRSLDAKIEELKADMPSTEASIQKLGERLNDLKARVTERADKTKNWADMIEKLSDNRVEAEVELEGDLVSLIEATDNLMARTGSQTATRHQKLSEAIAAKGVWDVLEAILNDCFEALRWRQMSASTTGGAPECVALSDMLGVTDKALASFLTLLDLQRVEVMATAVPAPAISLFYCDQDRRISFDKASEGQRAAALLFMLLEQPGGPLMIDQPEGDLDNKIVSELADKLHSAKQRRQIFFASHNANIVVNGSSELVVGMDVAPEAMRTVGCCGAIDSTDICFKITETMEGGKKAFGDRKDKYGY
ncbi:TrlF family AAA-like ATPase [Salipiger sp.]|uniref:TrlF family AAA-like ATPase n=1 Tax=Salipiger sp. TaxID=2078585 RepID=UPI003A986EEB